jgi:hypothetical protein
MKLLPSLDKLLVGKIGHEKVVFFLAEGVFPFPLLVHEVRVAGGGRTVLVRKPHCDPHDYAAAGAQPLHRLYVVDDLAIVCESLVLFEPLLSREPALGF